MRLVRFKVTFSDALVHRVKQTNLPSDWRAAPPSASTQAIGDAWARKAVWAVLAVPSVLIPEETNYLLLPAHPHFKKVMIGEPTDFALDYRVARLGEP